MPRETNPMPAFRPPVHRALQLTARFGVRLLWRIRVEGLENVPATGAVLVCPNHISAVDPVAVGAIIERPVFMMAKVELFRYLGWLLPAVGAFPVNRDARDTSAVRQTLRLLHAGRAVGLFPEGHRQHDGRLGQPRPGSGSLIGRSGAAVVPVAIRGDWRLFGRVEIRFGAPLDVSASQDPAGDVMRAIARLYYRPDQMQEGLPWAESD